MDRTDKPKVLVLPLLPSVACLINNMMEQPMDIKCYVVSDIIHAAYRYAYADITPTGYDGTIIELIDTVRGNIDPYSDLREELIRKLLVDSIEAYGVIVLQYDMPYGILDVVNIDAVNVFIVQREYHEL